MAEIKGYNIVAKMLKEAGVECGGHFAAFPGFDRSVGPYGSGTAAVGLYVRDEQRLVSPIGYREGGSAGLFPQKCAKVGLGSVKKHGRLCTHCASKKGEDK